MSIIAPPRGVARYPIPAVLGNFIHATLPTFPANSSCETRLHHKRPSPQASFLHGASANPLYCRYTTTAIAVYMLAHDVTFPTAGTLFSSIPTFPAVGQDVQTKLAWDHATTTLAQWWRLPTHELDDDVNGPAWTFLHSVSAPTKTLHTLGQFVCNEIASNTQWIGDSYRWMFWLNGVLTVDLNIVENATGDTAAITPTVGPVMAVTRSAEPNLEILPSVPRAYRNGNPILGAYYNGQPVTTIYSNP